MYSDNERNDLAMTERPLFRYMLSALVLTVVFFAAIRFMNSLYDDAAQFEFELLADRLTSSVNHVHRSWFTRGRPNRMSLTFNIEQGQAKRILVVVNRNGWPINVDSRDVELNCKNIWRFLAETLESEQKQNFSVNVVVEQDVELCRYKRTNSSETIREITYNPKMGSVTLQN